MDKNIHEDCGVAVIRLLKPLKYYQKKYGTWMYALNKLYLMMEKQHNRGQEGAGIASVKLSSLPGSEYMFRESAEGKNAVSNIFKNLHNLYKDYSHDELNDISFVEKNIPFAGELYMGHLRYSTTGKSGLSYVHPFLRRNNWKAKNLSMCGNFNMTNIEEVFQKLTAQGQCPRIYSDTYILLELMGHRLDREVERNFVIAKENSLEGQDITNYIEDNLDVSNVLKTTMKHFDGGYVICGMTGSGEMFSMRDPWGIRPAFYYKNDEIVVLASERPVLQTTFDLECENIKELMPGQALIVNRVGECSLQQIIEPKNISACSFERIYFSRGSDRDIYNEREKLGQQLAPKVLEKVDYDYEHAVLSYIPNTAEVAFYGLLHGCKQWLNKEKVKQLANMKPYAPLEDYIKIVNQDIRTEKVAWKDIKLRTFITEGNSRKDLASHVYDVTYSCIVPYIDNLVVIDDSIVRGTTLKESILRMLDRIHPKKIVIVSSAPQIRYPDYYGIDMPHLEEFCVFQATIKLIKERKMEHILKEVYEACKVEVKKELTDEIQNPVRAIYAPFTVEEINQKLVEMLRPEGMTTPVELIFQSIEGLHKAIPNHKGDWYFTGNYPTSGGMRLVNHSFIKFYENNYSISKEDNKLL